MYDVLKTAMLAIPSVHTLGYDSSRTNNTLPKTACRIQISDVVYDKTRPIPSAANRVEENAGDEIIKTYHFQGTFTGYDKRLLRYPQPVSFTYDIRTWCYSADEQLQMDDVMRVTFPTMGNIVVPIGDPSTDYEFPITFLSMRILDDLELNLRERVYSFRVDTYVASFLDSDEELKVITDAATTVHAGSQPEDFNMPGGNTVLVSVHDQAEEGD